MVPLESEQLRTTPPQLYGLMPNMAGSVEINSHVSSSTPTAKRKTSVYGVRPLPTTGARRWHGMGVSQRVECGLPLPFKDPRRRAGSSEPQRQSYVSVGNSSNKHTRADDYVIG